METKLRTVGALVVEDEVGVPVGVVVGEDEGAWRIIKEAIGIRNELECTAADYSKPSKA